eukprot:g6831.t1
MMISQARRILVAVLTMALASGVRSQGGGNGGSDGGNGNGEGVETPGPAPTEQSNPDNTRAPESTTAPFSAPPTTSAPSTTPPTTANPGSPAPSTAPPTAPTPAPGDGDDDSVDCGDGKAGAAGEDVSVCCASTCDACNEEDGCEQGDECCPSAIAESDSPCEEENPEPPCIVSTAEGDDGDDDGGSDDGSDSDSSAAVIALAAVLAVVLLGNAVCFCMLKRRKKSPTPSPLPVSTRSITDTEAGRQQSANAAAEIRRLQEELKNERSRRMMADGIIQRVKPGGLRPGDFPSVRDVDNDLENLAGHAIKWAEKACGAGGTAHHSALPATVRSVLENTFLVCRQEVKRCFDERLRSLSGFLGNDEPVQLSGRDDSMKLDTQYVLYECLRRNFRTIVPTEPESVKELAATVQQRTSEGGGDANGDLAGDIIFGSDDVWVPFDNLVKEFIKVFVEMALQKPAMDFEDDLSESRAFDPIVHRDWAPHLNAPMEQCCIVFPAILPQEGRPRSNAKTGVVRLPS